MAQSRILQRMSVAAPSADRAHRGVANINAVVDGQQSLWLLTPETRSYQRLRLNCCGRHRLCLVVFDWTQSLSAHGL
jgi:hypothetical protein